MRVATTVILGILHYTVPLLAQTSVPLEGSAIERMPPNMPPSLALVAGEFVIASRGSKLDVWAADGGRKVASLPVDRDSDEDERIWLLSQSPDGRWLATATNLGRLSLWKKARPDGEPPYRIARHCAPAVSGDDGERLKGFTRIDFSNDQDRFAWASQSHVDKKFQIHITDLENQKEAGIVGLELNSKRTLPAGFGWSPHDDVLWVMTRRRVDKRRATLRLAAWDAETLTKVPDAETSIPLHQADHIFPSIIGQGRYLSLSSSLTGTVKLFELPRGKTATFHGLPKRVWHHLHVFSNDVRLLAVGEATASRNSDNVATVRIWNVDQGEVVATLRHPEAIQAWPCAFSTDNGRLVTVVRYHTWQSGDESRPTHFIWDLSTESDADSSESYRHER